MALQTTRPTYKSELAPENPIVSAWNLVCHITYTRDTWVKLLQLPSEYASDEALLLCENSADTWFAWVPGYGQIVLNRSEFYC